jgi:hypothetical protein
LEKGHIGSYLQGGWPIAGMKLQARQFNLSGLQANGICYFIVPEENLG